MEIQMAVRQESKVLGGGLLKGEWDWELDKGTTIVIRSQL